MRKIVWSFLVQLLCLTGCIETDLMDEEIIVMQARIEVNPGNTAVQIGDSINFQAVYYDSLGEIFSEARFEWISSNTNIGYS